MPQEEEDRHQRLAAIAQLEQQHKMRRSHMEAEAQFDPISPRTGRYFLLLISKGSGNLQQRANQDRAETMLNGFPYETLDGANSALASKRDALFEISDVRGNYPQLFFVVNGMTNYIGGFDEIEYHNDEGTLREFLDEQPESPRKKTSVVGAMKGMLKGGSKREMNHRAVDTDPLSQRSMSGTSRASNKSTVTDSSATPAAVQKAPSPKSADQSCSSKKKSKSKKEARRASLNSTAKTPPALEEEEEQKPASTGRLSLVMTDGEPPLIDQERKKDNKEKGDRLLRRQSKSKETKRCSSKGKYRSKEGKLSLNDEAGEDEKSTKSSKTSKSGRSRSRSAGKYRDKLERNDDSEAKVGEKKEKFKLSRSRSLGKMRESVKSSKGEGREGETDLKEGDSREEDKRILSRSKSRSKRDSRAVETEAKEEETQGENDKSSKPRKGRSKRQLITKAGDSETAAGDMAIKPKNRTRLRDKDAEKHPRRGGIRSASPHKLREKTKRADSVRSNSPGKFRGDIARKREAMKEFREKKSLKSINDDADDGDIRRPRRHQSVKQLETSSSSLLTPRRNQSLMNFNKKDKNTEQIDESLHDLVMRVKEKDRKAKEPDDDEGSNAESAGPSVQW